LAGKRQERLRFAASIPFSSDNIINCDLEIEDLENGLTRLHNLETEFFTEVEE